MKIWLNNALRRSIWYGLDRELSREFTKWNGYPHNPYGDSCIREDCNRLYWQDEKAFCLMRKSIYGRYDTPVLNGFRWYDIL